MKQLQDEAQKSRKKELQSQKAIAQLEKQQRVKDNQIKSLEADQKRKEVVLKRKLEEVGVSSDFYIHLLTGFTDWKCFNLAASGIS